MRSINAMFDPLPVLLISPLPKATCEERLSELTDNQRFPWYPRSQNVGKKAPILRGSVEHGLYVARFDETLGRNSFAPYLDAQLEAVSDGGTEIRGTIGLSRSVTALLPIMQIVGAVVLLIVFVVGVVQLAEGHLSPGIPFVIGVIILGVFETALFRSASRSFHTRVEPLITDVTKFIDGIHSTPQIDPERGRP